MTKRFLAGAFLAVLAMSSAGAFAHDDPSSDTTTRCDNWYRVDHESDPNGNPQPGSKDSHHHKAGTDREVGPVYVHNHSGHYVVRTPAGYVEVIGGQGYKGHTDNTRGMRTFPGQGGFVQGEIDAGNGTPDVDFWGGVFAPDTDNLPQANAAAIQAWVEQGTHYRACVNQGNTRTERKSW